MDFVLMIVILVALIAMMWWQSRKAKQQQQERKDFRENLQPGTEIITIGGIIGKVVSVDVEYEEIVIDSEGSLLRFGFNAISREYTRPAFVHEDENGNPLPQDDEQGQVPMDDAIETAPEPAEVIETSEAGDTADTESK